MFLVFSLHLYVNELTAYEPQVHDHTLYLYFASNKCLFILVYFPNNEEEKK